MNTSNAQNDPARNTQFRRRWVATLPTTPDEIRLAKLRIEFGNIEGTARFQAARARQLGWRR